MAGESEEKSLPPSEKKLRDARKKGQVFKSRDFVSATVTLAAVGLVVTRAQATSDTFTALIVSTGELLRQPPSVALPVLASQIAASAENILGPLLALLVMSTILASVIVTQGLVLSLDPLMPSLQKLNPAKGLKNLVSVKGLIEILKGMLKMAVIVAIAVHVIRDSLAALVELPACGLPCSASVLAAPLLHLVGASVLVFLVFGLADVVLQRWLFIKNQRMSKTEMKNERKNTDGNPQIKSAHKRHLKEASQIKAGLHQATFIVAGTRLAVAMRYSAVDTRVPTSVAHAEADEVTEFVQSARRLRLPIVHDPATARALFEKVQIGKSIPSELFQPVINCMRRADAMT